MVAKTNKIPFDSGIRRPVESPDFFGGIWNVGLVSARETVTHIDIHSRTELGKIGLV